MKHAFFEQQRWFMGKEVFCAPFRGGRVFRRWSSDEENENEGIEERGIENENAIEIPLNNGAGAKAVANHSSQIARNEVEASYNLNAQINSIGMHLEEMVLTNDGHLTSLKCIDSF